MGVCDDAGSKVAAAHFQVDYRDAADYLRLFRQVVTTTGITLSVYGNQHGTSSNDKHKSLEEELASTQSPTQVDEHWRSWHRSDCDARRKQGDHREHHGEPFVRAIARYGLV